MASNEIKYTQSVWGYQEVKRKFWLEGKNRVWALYLRPPDAHCPKCRSRNVRAHRHRDRTLTGLPNGKCQVRFVVPVRKVVCRDCRAVTYERVAFAVYKNAKTYADAAPLFDEWINDASASEVPELRSAAKTFKRNRDGILAYWSSGGMNNAATEGFNRKTRGLLETAYGFHDYKFLRLRIFDLGERKSIKD